MQTRVLTPDDVAALYRKAFDQVCDPTDWKAPIDCEVPWELANLYMQAVEFMTGVRPSYERVGVIAPMARIICCGYRNGPCGG